MFVVAIQTYFAIKVLFTKQVLARKVDQTYQLMKTMVKVERELL